MFRDEFDRLYSWWVLPLGFLFLILGSFAKDKSSHVAEWVAFGGAAFSFYPRSLFCEQTGVKYSYIVWALLGIFLVAL